ncbi:RpiR family transcriptional regulator [Ketogulonicigenium vulgare Y25]|uniref:MurR/RpiR family transcriptional regulator n=1 Tax=Ketogulonicigenium vulgare TaxID=92945 RepID=UPI0001E6561B|nr:MurR/RpiR family transcriptional regulator [Ketogulonicigenium vulgare]ADO41334.1 RpiR family transcriptional regulator [Ketogulonicigenium vulgare Y25]
MNHGNRLFSGLPAESTVARAIQNALPAMSEAQRRFAALVQAEPLRVARLSINDAVSGADVSVATANRFATALGYAGYPEFRADLIRAFEDFFVPVERLKRRQAEKRSAMDIAQAAFAEDLESIGATASSLDSASLEAAVQQIIAARRVFVAGFDLSAHLGGMLAIGLVMTGWGGAVMRRPSPRAVAR